jgi:hypothetical protein
MIKLFSFLAFELTFVFLLAFWNRKYYNHRLNNFAIAFFSTLFFYVSIIGLVIIIRYVTKKELESFDLDGNGFIDRDEVTPASVEASNKAVHDTGLTMAPFIGIIYSIIYFILIVIPLALFNRRKQKNQVSEL